jgi:hypothetical protein
MEKLEMTSNLFFDKMLYRCQFILGPSFIDKFHSWKRISINTSMKLTLHPDLNCYHSAFDDKSITLLGFILNPKSPQSSDNDIIDNLIDKLDSCDDFCEYTHHLGGRWILIVNDGKQIKLFNDPLGLRQVFYSDMHDGNTLWCASQPQMIAELLRLQVDKEARNFIESYNFRKNEEYWWPGDSSPYKRVKHLLPNHCIELKTGLVTRFWPTKKLLGLSLNEAKKLICEEIKGLMCSVHNRFDLALSLTAGWDSRLVLSASKDISDDISYMTVRQIRMPDNAPDIRVPVQLLSELGFRHDMVKATPWSSSEFVRIFKMSSPLAHDIWAPDAHAILEYYKLRKVVVVGSGSEVARCFYRIPKYENQHVTAKRLSLMAGMGDHPFAIHYHQNWLSGLGKSYGFNVLDLFYWEQRAGNWLAMCQLEFGMVWKEIFAPFNCRSLLTNMLSVDEQYRKHDEPMLYKELITNLWPEVLSEPINPHKKKAGKHQLKKYCKSYVKYQFKKLELLLNSKIQNN